MKKLNCILLVDDDPIVIFIHTSLITSLDLADTILTAQNGKEALALIAELNKPDDTINGPAPELILLDISMPVMNGFEFLENFEELDLKLRPKVVLLSNSTNPTDKLKAEKFTLAGNLNKPLSTEALQALMAQSFQQQEQL